MNDLTDIYCRRVEWLSERLAAVCKERDELKAENIRLNRENFEQSIIIAQLEASANGT